MKRLLTKAASLLFTLLSLVLLSVLAMSLFGCSKEAREAVLVDRTPALSSSEWPIGIDASAARGASVSSQAFAFDGVTSSTQGDPQAQPQTLPNEQIPYQSAPRNNRILGIGEEVGSWSLANSVFCLIGFMETVFAIGIFFYQNRQDGPNLFTANFMLRMLALGLTLICFIATLITSDFSQPLVMIDKMSVLIVIVFATQQAILLCARRLRRTVLVDTKKEKHFRAKHRYEK